MTDELPDRTGCPPASGWKVVSYQQDPAHLGQAAGPTLREQTQVAQIAGFPGDFAICSRRKLAISHRCQRASRRQRRQCRKDVVGGGSQVEVSDTTSGQI